MITDPHPSFPSSFLLCRKPGYLDNELCEGICDNFQKFWGFLSILEVEALHYEVDQVLQVTGGSLQRQEHHHGEPVEEVVDGGPCKGPAGEPHPETGRSSSGWVPPRQVITFIICQVLPTYMHIGIQSHFSSYSNPQSEQY